MAKTPGEKTGGSDGIYQRMISGKKAGKSPQKNGEQIYSDEGWDDDPEIESGAEAKQRFQKQREHDIMMAHENRRKKLGLGKLDKKAKK